ncbi:VWA domain-containing protein [Neolewinella lacunae]|uniref:VWA domain-containing protein n=1 Tax=Neolewinella lacunae TaxID=1517758 RepID=A0A923T796_9BACT|nr:VWA domain-containing protein [Neolewinella lacunae]MBC6993356.1 VWA domain-containing protein [Neolewinella lacunae]MDN3636346.1 VWA domain-containing protein [Neolewinella lacunae]
MKLIRLSLAILALGLLHSCGYHEDFAPRGFSDIGLSGDTYLEVGENPFLQVAEQPVSTFSVDADGASYANVRRFIQQDNQLPPVGAVRTEELINYFDLDYEFSDPTHPIALHGEVSQCPWNPSNKLMRIGIKGKPIPENERPAANFVFLIDVSGSMGSEDKLELLKSGFKLFVDELQATDRVAIVTYAGSAGVVLESTPGSDQATIKRAIDALGSGGSTAGAEGIITAYAIAQEHFIVGGNNRIVVGTDGDFNVGPSSQEELVALIEEKRESGIFLTVLGVGRGNLNDAALEQIANNGNGTYEYIDNIEQLRKVFIYEYNKFFTVAKDVKVQVVFNPENVTAYRLIGYENRLLSEEDFEDDSADAGEIGADQNVTALYEIVPKANPEFKTVPTFTIDFRYKQAAADNSVLLDLQVFDEGKSFDESTDFMKFTASVASFSMLITDSQYKGASTYDQVLHWIGATNLNDEHRFKAEFRSIVEKAKRLE